MLKAASRVPPWCRLGVSVFPAALPVARRTAGPLANGARGCLAAAPISSGDSTGTLKFAITADAVQLGRRQGPLALYESLVESGELRDDLEQRRVLEILNAVYHGAPRRQSKGLYLYGDVGCGKTMAMDLFFSSMQNAGLRVERKHFHDFLNEAHRLLHQMKTKEGPAGTPVERLAQHFAGRFDVLCFDEFAVTTIQDCVLMMPLFSAFFQLGVTIVTTSNRAPEDLYTDGLNRHLYLPAFLTLLRAHCKVHHLTSSIDYRTVHYENSPDAGVYCWPHDRHFVDNWFQVLAGNRGSSAGCLDISYGRSVSVPQLSSCGRIARFAFDDICRGFYSADDYLYLARQVHTILLEDVPILTVDDHNEARRFTTLIDSCYEQHVRLICSMACPPEELLGGLIELRSMSMATLGSEGTVGCGDGDTSPASSGVMQAIRRIKEGMAEREQQRHNKGENVSDFSVVGPHTDLMHSESATDVLSAEIERVRSHGTDDVAVWRQGSDTNGGRSSSGLTPMPQVSKAWDDRRRISQFTWESADPTAEAKTIKGVFTAAVASLQESGFAVDRCISRLKEMQTDAFQQTHRVKYGLV